MADSDLNKTISVFDADSEVVYDESNRKRRLSDSSASHGCKRLCTVSESTSWSSDQTKNGTPQKASGTEVHVISTESEDSQSVPGNCLTKIASLELPSRLSELERKHIEKLNISIVHVPDTKPLDLIQCGETKNYEETEKINELKKYVQKSSMMGHLRSLDHLYTSFTELSSESLWEMAPNDDEKISMIPTWVPEQHILWFYRFHCQAHNFSNQLYHILKRRENGCSVHESHMQALFEAFACMFGLQSGLSVPCLEKDTKRIMNLEISGAADIIFPSKMFSPFQEVKQGTQHPSVVAVCEVKRDSPKLNQSCSPLNSRTCTDIKINFENSAEQISSTTNTEASHNKTVLHLDDKIIGQHGGKLLFHFSDTIKNGKIFGLVVQETQVTFTMLEMSVEQYNDIVEGNVKHRSGDRPVLKFTKPYDYLKTQDRESIIEAFIKLAMLQRKIL
ncbi:uncharacterized protein LOC128159019 isoform X2 [Crassostrea angulata]|uniref:uncharacterized protein LOC128159019 isoform X2 n=1 Tax=Magallana angulata TaxID=2784310 RepID=UPI0022B18976|nr:uncharacterized protein LOC128159019 isoform X2 [Crassostrea angulata]